MTHKCNYHVVLGGGTKMMGRHERAEHFELMVI